MTKTSPRAASYASTGFSWIFFRAMASHLASDSGHLCAPFNFRPGLANLGVRAPPFSDPHESFIQDERVLARHGHRRRLPGHLRVQLAGPPRLLRRALRTAGGGRPQESGSDLPVDEE